MKANRLGAVFVALALVFGGLIAPAQAQQTAQHQQWQTDLDLLNTLLDELRAQGLMAVKPRVAELEAALGVAPALFAPEPWGDGNRYVLVDGQAEATTALLTAAAGVSSGEVSALDNPYHLLSLYLGVYYNEIGRPEDALRTLEAGLALSADPQQLLGETIPALIAERGASYVALKRWDDSLASYEEGLALGNLSDRDHALLLRGRGFALVELERLDEAKAAYEESLTFEPGNEIATGELQYIANLLAGGKKSAPNLTLKKN